MSLKIVIMTNNYFNIMSTTVN